MFLFFPSHVLYPEHNQLDPDNPICTEDSAYPADPDSGMAGKSFLRTDLFAYNRNHSMNFCVARYHNIFGEMGTFAGGKEKAPAALCRKVALAENGGHIEVWGDGLQTRSFLHVNDCIEATVRLMRSDFNGPVNIGSGNDFHK